MPAPYAAAKWPSWSTNDSPGRTVRAVAQAISALMWGFAHTYLVDGDTELTEENAVDLVTDLIHRGIAGRPPE